MNVPALVLAAGLGTRLDPITRLVAKPAVPLGGRTLIEHVVSWLGDQNVRDLVVNLHHRPETIAAVLGDGAHLGLRVRYSWEQPVLGSAGGPRRALPLLGAGTFLIVNGDTLCDFDLRVVVDAHRERGAGVTLAVVPNSAPDRYNGVVVGEDGAVVGFAPKGREAVGTWHLVGVQVAEAEVFAPLADGEPAESVAGFYRDLIRDSPGRIRACPVATSFLDVGTPADYFAACTREAGVGPDGVVQWPRSSIDAGADLARTIVLSGVHVPAGFHARSAILAPAAIVRAGDDVPVEQDVAIFSRGLLD